MLNVLREHTDRRVIRLVEALSVPYGRPSRASDQRCISSTQSESTTAAVAMHERTISISKRGGGRSTHRLDRFTFVCRYLPLASLAQQIEPAGDMSHSSMSSTLGVCVVDADITPPAPG